MNVKNVLQTVGWMTVAFVLGKASGLVVSERAVNKCLEKDYPNMKLVKIDSEGLFSLKGSAEIVKLAEEVKES